MSAATETPVTLGRPVGRTTLQTRLASVRWSDLHHAGADGHELAYRHWQTVGGPSTRQPLLTAPTHNAKASKSTRPEYVMHLAPHRVAGIGTVCAHSTPGCREHCLYYAGHGSRRSVQRGRVARTLFAYHFPTHFMGLLVHHLYRVHNRHAFDDAPPLVRLNGTSDIDWTQTVMDDVAREWADYWGTPTFADYTKADRYARPSRPHWPMVRSLWSDRYTASDVVAHWVAGDHVAVIVDDVAQLVERTRSTAKFDPAWSHWPVCDASASDEWILSPRPTIGALRPMVGADAFHWRDIFNALHWVDNWSAT